MFGRQSPGSLLLSSSNRVRAPSLLRHYPASAVLRAPPPSAFADAGPHGFIVESDSRSQTSLVAHLPSPTRAAVTTPVESPIAFLARFTGDIGLSQNYGGSTSTLAVSRPARRSLALQPAWTTNPLKGPFLEVLQVIRRLLTRPECFRLEREFADPGLHRGGKCTLSRHT